MTVKQATPLKRATTVNQAMTVKARANARTPRPPYPSANGLRVPRVCSRIGTPGSPNASRNPLTRYRR